MQTMLTLLVVERGNTGELRLLGDLFLIVVPCALLLIYTAPFWGLGVICWSWHRESRRSRKRHQQLETCSQNECFAVGPPISTGVGRPSFPGVSAKMGTVLPLARKMRSRERNCTAQPL
jgi:hypothetical protein